LIGHHLALMMLLLPSRRRGFAIILGLKLPDTLHLLDANSRPPN
jgi:hypothetical protein